MSSRLTSVDLSRLPAPQVIEPLEFEALFDTLRERLVLAAPELAPALALESEPAVKVLQIWAHEVIRTRARVNDAARAVLLAHATGADLDNLAALLGVTRAVMPGAPEADPPIPTHPEPDARFRERVRLALQAYSNAGPAGAYRYWAFSADARVRDVYVDSPDPGEVRVTVMAEAPGPAPLDLLAAVNMAVQAPDVRVLTDLVTVQAATEMPFTVNALLTITSGGTGPVLAAARASLDAYLASRQGLGLRVSRSKILAALHVEGVLTILMSSPAADVAPAPTEFVICTDIALAPNLPGGFG